MPLQKLEISARTHVSTIIDECVLRNDQMSVKICIIFWLGHLSGIWTGQPQECLEMSDVQLTYAC